MEEMRILRPLCSAIDRLTIALAGHPITHKGQNAHRVIPLSNYLDKNQSFPTANLEESNNPKTS